MKYSLLLMLLLSVQSLKASNLLSKESYLIMYKEAASQFVQSGLNIDPGIYLAFEPGVIKRPDLKNITSGDVYEIPGTNQQIVAGYASGEFANTRNEIWGFFNGKYFLLSDQSGKSKKINKGVPKSIIPSFEGMFLITASDKILYRHHDAAKNLTLQKQTPVKAYDPSKKIHALTRDGRNLIYLTDDFKIILHKNDGTKVEIGKTIDHPKRGPQLALTGDGIFLPQGADKVKYLSLNSLGEVEKEEEIFTKRPSEMIIFSNNEIKIVQMKAGGGKAIFFLNRFGLVVPAHAASGAMDPILTASEVNNLLTFAQDWRLRARQGNFANVVPDIRLYDEMIAELMSDNDTWVNLHGAFGVGKSTALKGFAHYLINKKAHDSELKDYELFMTSTSSLLKLYESALAVTKAPAQPGGSPPPVMGKNDPFTLLIKSLTGKKVFLMIDDFLDDPELGPTNVQKAMDFFLKTFRNLLKKGDVRIITTCDNLLWAQMIQANTQLNYMVHSISLREPDLDQLDDIIRAKMRELDSEFKVDFEEGVLNEVISSSKELFPRKVEPARTIDALDSMVRHLKSSDGSTKRISVLEARKYLLKFVFDASKLEKLDLPEMRKEIDSKIIGHDQVKDKIFQDLGSLKLGVTAMNKPLGLYLFTGPTGVGKTEMAKVLAKAMDLPLVNVNMATFEGFKKGTPNRDLIERKKGTPFVLLLDEVDKRTDGYASADRLNELRSLFNSGEYAKGTKDELDLRNAIIIMTANYGDTLITNLGDLGQEQYLENFERYVLNEDGNTPDKDLIPIHVWSYLRENTFIFKSLNEDELEQVTRKLVGELSDELERRDQISLVVGDRYVERIVAISFERKLGVVPIKEKINKTLKRAISAHLTQLKEEDLKLPYPKRLFPLVSKIYVDVDTAGNLVLVDNSNPHFPKGI